MKRKITSILALLIVSAMVLSSCSSSSSSKYPEKPIEVIVAFAAGGGTDVAARVVFEYVKNYIPDSTFAVINKPGASGEIGFTALANVKADGYTIGMINPPSFLMYPIQRGDEVKYTIDDFEYIANIVADPGCFAVGANSPYTSMDDVIADAKEKGPGVVSLAYTGPGTAEALTIRRIEEMFDVEFNKVQFDGSAASVVALMGNHVDFLTANASDVYTQYKENTVRVLGVGTDERIDMMPDVPTYKESNIDLVQVSLRGIAAPKGISEEHKNILAEAIKNVMEDPDFLAKADEMTLPLQYMGPDEYKEFLEKTNEDLKNEYEINPW